MTRPRQASGHPVALLLAAVFAILAIANGPAGAAAPEPAERIRAEVILVGDRLVDVAYHLGVVPAALSARAAMWPLARELGRTSSRLLGCPKCVTVKTPDAIPQAIKELGIRRVLIEKSPRFCLYEPKVNPEKVADLLAKRQDIEKLGVTVEFVDFGNGLDTAIRRTAKLLDREGPAEKLIAEHNETQSRVRAKLPDAQTGKTVVILDGIYQEQTGKTFVRVEAPGGYSDRFLLEPLGLRNGAGAFLDGGAKPSKGHVVVRKLDGLLAARPDMIAITGDADAVQRLLRRERKRLPEMKEIPALRDGAVFALPRYIDSGIIEYPLVLQRWAKALGDG